MVATLPAGVPHRSDTGQRPRGRFVPHAPVLDRAACAVTHGGMGATQKALARGVPVCAVPFGRDQLEVARRVEVAGAGTRLPAKRLRPDRLRAKVREAIRRARAPSASSRRSPPRAGRRRRRRLRDPPAERELPQKLPS